MALKRLQKEYLELVKTPVPGCSAAPSVEGELFTWKAFIDGPSETPYEGGKFELKLVFPTDYPFKPPTVSFTTSVFHPNVRKSDGYICLDVLKAQWSPALHIDKVLLSVQSLLASPNPDSPLESEIAMLLKSNKAEYDRQAKAHTAANAMKK